VHARAAGRQRREPDADRVDADVDRRRRAAGHERLVPFVADRVCERHHDRDGHRSGNPRAVQRAQQQDRQDEVPGHVPELA